MVDHVGKIFVAERLERTGNGVARRLTEAAERRLADGLGEVLEHVEVLKRALIFHDPRQNFEHAFGALAARHALAAAFALGEVHEEAGGLDHAGILVHDDQGRRSP